jgi:hypothetical protein
VNIVRARSMPINRATPRQTKTRTLLMPLASRWSANLTPSERAAWGSYAAATPIPAPWAGTKTIAGFAMYFRNMRPRLLAGMTLLSAAPSVSGLPTYTTPTFGLLSGGGTLQVGFTSTDAWANEAGGAMFVFVSMQRSSSRTYTTERWTYAGTILGAASPPSSPASFTLTPALVNTRNSIWFRVSVTRADGRLSA